MSGEQANKMATAAGKTAETGNKIPFGQWLVSKGILSYDELILALNEQSKHGGKLGEVLLRTKIPEAATLTRFLADYLSLEYKSLNEISEIDLKIARMLPETVSKRFSLVAIGEEDNKIVLAMADPLDVVAVDTISLRLNREIKVVVSSHDEIVRAIEMIYHSSDAEEPIDKKKHH